MNEKKNFFFCRISNLVLLSELRFQIVLQFLENIVLVGLDDETWLSVSSEVAGDATKPETGPYRIERRDLSFVNVNRLKVETRLSAGSEVAMT